MSAITKLSERLREGKRKPVPKVSSFREFLEKHARVKTQGGEYIPYSFEGREALIPIVEVFDEVLGSHTGKPLPDSTLDICGGAQFGKTILALNFGSYVTAVRFLNWGYYLPDDDLVEGIVDTKLRPDVIEQIDWLGSLMEVGKTEDKRGRSVNRKGAFQVSDGERKAFGMIRGMGKIPTSFSMDVAMEDEKDDIPAKRSKYLTGRMTASDLRLRSSIGTQRTHAAGQQKQWEEGSQGIFVFKTDRGELNLEENWPAVCRMAVDGTPKSSDPKLTEAGDFRDQNGRSWGYDPGANYYFADPETGYVIKRHQPLLRYLKPERIKLRKWSWRISQFTIAAISPSQFVSRWQDAVRDPDMMTVFRCDVMALPANTEQAITPSILKRSRSVDEPFDLSLAVTGKPRFAGLDTGNRCWFLAREVHAETSKRVQWAEQIPLSQMVARTEALFYKLGIACLAIDANPAVDEARSLCYRLNGLEDLNWLPFNGHEPTARLEFPSGLAWDGELKRWEKLKCFVVEFSQKPGSGIVHKLGIDPQGGFNKFFPVIQCNRFESISRVVNEFLTVEEGFVKVIDGEALREPVMRLPRLVEGSPPIIKTLDDHLMTGSKRETTDSGEKKDFADHCENHLLLADAYSALSEMVGGHGVMRAPFAFQSVPSLRPAFRRKGGGL